MIRAFDLTPGTGTLSAATQFYTPVFPTRGARTVMIVVSSTTGGASGGLACNFRYGEEAIASSTDKMAEGDSGHAVSSLMTASSVAVNTFYTFLASGLGGNLIMSAFMRARIVCTTTDVPNAKVTAYVSYAEDFSPASPNGSVIAPTTVAAAGNY